MYMMFVDESGDPGYPANGNWKEWRGSTHFARVGVIIHGWKWKAWNDRLMSFKRNRGLTWDAEIKATHVRKGIGAFVGWNLTERMFFLENLAELIGGAADLTLLGVVIDKRDVDTTKGPRLVKPEVRSLELMLERYNFFLRDQKDRSGIVVLDPTKESSDDNLRYFQSFLLQESDNLKPLHIVEGTFFAKSHTSNLIQMADVCTHLFYREMTKGVGGRPFRLIHPRFWKRGTRVQGYGIKKWP